MTDPINHITAVVDFPMMRYQKPTNPNRRVPTTNSLTKRVLLLNSLGFICCSIVKNFSFFPFKPLIAGARRIPTFANSLAGALAKNVPFRHRPVCVIKYTIRIYKNDQGLFSSCLLMLTFFYPSYLLTTQQSEEVRLVRKVNFN